MKEKKGIAVSAWIWIVGGILIAIITTLIVYTAIANLREERAVRHSENEFVKINEDISWACRNPIGNRKIIETKLNYVNGIYAAETRGEPDSQIPQYISDQETAKGEYICLDFGEYHYGCVEHSCEINMTYIGTPLPGTEMYVLGNSDQSFDFELTIEKTGTNQVTVEARHQP